MYVKSIYGKIIYMCAYVYQNILYHTLHILYYTLQSYIHQRIF